MIWLTLFGGLFLVLVTGIVAPVVTAGMLKFLSPNKNHPFAWHFALGGIVLSLLCSFFLGDLVVAGANLAVAIGAILLNKEIRQRLIAAESEISSAARARIDNRDVRRGSVLAGFSQLQRAIDQRQREWMKRSPDILPPTTRIDLGGVELSPEYEPLGIFCLGAPGSGKTVSISAILNSLRERGSSDRVIVLDRNCELLERFGRPDDIIFNPYDSRTHAWSHTYESANSKTIATSLIPASHPDGFWGLAAQELVSVLLQRVQSLDDLDLVLSSGFEAVNKLVQGTRAAYPYRGALRGETVLHHLSEGSKDGADWF
jgi:hypothetical protein